LWISSFVFILDRLDEVQNKLEWLVHICLCLFRCFRQLPMGRHKSRLKYSRVSVKWPVTTNYLASFSWFVLFLLVIWTSLCHFPLMFHFASFYYEKLLLLLHICQLRNRSVGGWRKDEVQWMFSALVGTLHSWPFVECTFSPLLSLHCDSFCLRRTSRIVLKRAVYRGLLSIYSCKNQVDKL